MPPRRRIMDAAVHLFFAHGFTETTVREITNACGLTPGALYNHFPSKDALLVALIDETYDVIEASLDEALRKAGDDPVDQLRRLIVAFVRFHTEYRVQALVVNEEYKALPEPERSAVVKRRRAVRQLLDDVLRRGTRSGVFQIPKVDKVDTMLSAMAIGDMCHSVADWFHPDGRLPADVVAEFYAELVLRMVRKA